MDLYNLVLSAKLIKGEGGGGDIDVDALTVTENGVYSASSGHAYSPVTVSVPQSGITPTGTSNITANGIYDVTNFASASVAVPGASGTTNITSNGIYDIASFASASVNVPGIVPSGTSSITANGIYDITNFASVDVNVSGGGGGDHDVEDAIIMKTISGVYENSRVTSIGDYALYSCSKLSSVNFPNATKIGYYAFNQCRSLTSASFPNATSIASAAFYGCGILSAADFPAAKSIFSSAFNGCTSMTYASFPKATFLGGRALQNCYSLSALYLLGSSVTTLGDVNTFYNNPFSVSSHLGHFGSIYVPASLVDSYKTATNWSVYADRITAYEG